MTKEEAIGRYERIRYNLLNREDKEAVDIAFVALMKQEEFESKLRALESSGWISVEDRLPEENQRVILYIPRVMEGGNVRTGWLEPIKMWYTDSRDRLFYKQVTHWMPMPEPPKEEV